MRQITLANFHLMTVTDVAAYHECNERTVLRWIEAKLIPVITIGQGNRTQYLIPKTEVIAFKRPNVGRKAKKGKRK